ncbi:hypothetical protein B0T17DRAFT_498747 [Bombardia bombarda]|uniref:Flavin-containing monooxygenase n=1 Tax=Bombardia bombarda TaxID=252184 RepID=A0AA39TMT5_9PEZI|nr:hypothetical protein B0T17DRAFT_498747 [Bombardia bombarda]
MAQSNGVHANGADGNGADINPAYPKNFTLPEGPVENQRPLKVVVVGAGFSGILLAIRIPQRLRNVELVVYERNEGVGGVWYYSRLVNNYPGVACDIPSHSYQYTFAPNPDWSNIYAPGPEIRKYLEGVATRYGATRFIKTSHNVNECVWDEGQKKWTVMVDNLATGNSFVDTADILITARGQLSDISWPDIPDLNKFQGKTMHSGQWDSSFDIRNKTVGIIGNGSSAIQIIPKLQKVEGTSLKCFMRSPTWISSGFGDEAMVQLGLDPKITEFSEEQRRAFAEDPELYFRSRKAFESSGNVIHDSTFMGTEMQAAFQNAFRQSMEQRLAARPDLLEKIIPTFAPGCRRLTPGKGYLEALQEENVETIHDPIAKITETGLETASGRRVDFDVLVCATGFKAASAPLFGVVGRNGLSLTQRWSNIPESYLSLACDGFPNMLMMLGPNAGIGFGSLTKILEAEADYITQVIRKMQKENYITIEPKVERVRDFTEVIGTYFAKTVYLDKCKSWYRAHGGKSEWIAVLWPGSTLHFLETLRSPRWEDWVYESAEPSGNALSWLGMGRSITHVDGDPSWYINPTEVDFPPEGKPEDDPRYKARPWSY